MSDEPKQLDWSEKEAIAEILDRPEIQKEMRDMANEGLADYAAHLRKIDRNEIIIE